MSKVTPMSGVRKSAILMLSLDEDVGSSVMKMMSSNDVQKISQEMLNLSSISNDDLEAILAEFMSAAEQQAALNVDVNEHLRSILIKSLGEEDANTILDELVDNQQSVYGIEKMNLMEPVTVAEILRDEHPQIIAAILVHLERGQAADILEYYEPNLFHDVMLRILTFKGVQPGAFDSLNNVLNNMLEGQNMKRSKMGGVKAAAEILNFMSSNKEESAIEAVRVFNEDLAQKIIDEMFLFENLIDLDNRAIQTILSEVDMDSLAIALKGSDPALVDKFVSQMSTRAAEVFLEDMETRGPVRISVAEAEQKKIIQQIRQMAADGRIDIEVGEDVYV